jgi:glycerol-3-phosphate acyltransferase PlsY
LGQAIGGFFVGFGHMFPIYYRFRGGKGVACYAMVALVINPWVFLGILGTFVVVLIGTRFVSLASVMAALMYPIFMNAFASDKSGSVAMGSSGNDHISDWDAYKKIPEKAFHTPPEIPFAAVVHTSSAYGGMVCFVYIFYAFPRYDHAFRRTSAAVEYIHLSAAQKIQSCNIYSPCRTDAGCCSGMEQQP